MRNTYLVTALVVAQAVSARVFWGIPDPHAESVVALARFGGAFRLYDPLARDMQHLEEALERIRSSAEIERSESIVVLSNLIERTMS